MLHVLVILINRAAKYFIQSPNNIDMIESANIALKIFLLRRASSILTYIPVYEAVYLLITAGPQQLNKYVSQANVKPS